MPRKYILPAFIAGSIVVGGAAGAVIGVPALSGAETRTVQAQQGQDQQGQDQQGWAQQGRHGPREHFGDRLEAAAGAIGISVDDLKAALKDGKSIADVAKEKGVDVNTVVDAIAAVERTHIEEFVNNPLPPRGDHDGDDHGPGVRGPGFMREGIETAAGALGVSVDDLKAALKDGKSIADVAKEKGVDVNTVIDALVADAQKHIDEAVAAGKLPPEWADDMKQNVKDRVTAMVNGERPKRGPDGPRGFGGRHGGPPPVMDAPGEGAPGQADPWNGSGSQNG